MNDRPGFLGYDGEDLRGELVRHAQADVAPRAAQHRVLSRVTGAAAGAGMLGFAAAGTAASAVKTTMAVTAAGVAKWIAVGFVAGTVTVAAVETTRPSAPRVSPVAESVEIAAPVAVEPTRAPAPRVEAPLPLEIPVAAVPASAARRAPEPAEVDEPEPKMAAQEPTALAQELDRLEQVRQAMAQGRAARALDLLRRYDRDFAAGSMSSEAAALRVEALVQAGRHEEAREAARAFLAEYPRSPLSDRVRAAGGL